MDSQTHIPPTPQNQIQAYEQPKPPALPIPLSLAVVGVILIGIGMYWPHSRFQTPYLPETESQAAAVSLPQFAASDIEARAAIVYDVRSGAIIFEKNARIQLPLASLTKLMLVLTAAEILPIEKTITITPSMLYAEGDNGFVPGQEWKLLDLIDAALVSSSNDAATALALSIGEGSAAGTVNLMNKNARLLGLHQTYFLNPTGLDESTTVSGAYGSAYDVAKLLAQLVATHSDMLDHTSRSDVFLTSQNGSEVRAQNTNEALNDIPGLIAGKTGYTDLAGGNLAVAFDVDVGHPMIVVVLGSSQEGRFKDVGSLVRATRDAFQ